MWLGLRVVLRIPARLWTNAIGDLSSLESVPREHDLCNIFVEY